MEGTDTNSKILFRNVRIFDSTGADPYPGDVLIHGERIAAVGDIDISGHDITAAKVIEGNGRFLMSGLCDAHTHLTWNNTGNLDALGDTPVEEHTLFAMRSARTYLDYGYTMCFGAASAKQRIDVVIRNAVNAGDIAGPRYLANGQEMAPPGGELIPSITAYASGPEEMRRVVKRHIETGCNQIKLSMSGEEITERLSADDTTFSDDEVKACVETAHAAGLRVCGHARSAESVIQCVTYGVDVIYHASYIDSEGMDMLEKAKDKHWVAPGINWIVGTLNDAAAFGYTPQKAEQVGYKRELEAACKGMQEMRRRGIRVLPGGDYGFAWTPHGTYARDLDHMVRLFGYTPKEALIIATAGGGDMFMHPNDLGKIQPGFLADLILVDGNPLEDIKCLQDLEKIQVVMINGRIHREGSGAKESAEVPPVAGDDGNVHVIVPDLDLGKMTLGEGSPQTISAH
ncbi:amidohydrolase [Saitoella complicata NRRL Y-17804]|nr:amidohydrolase [Saitoella complicata NRRL Y-17804]ODQ55797.1 amidohydrolase [Saitoella complicata NRRL Y-17804]